jgi:hypothetical protein
MKTLLAAAAGLALLAGASAASAESYASVGYSHIKADDSGVDVTLGGVTGRLGVNLNPWFGVEGEVSVGVKDDTIAGTDVKLKHEIGVFAVARAPLGEGFTVLGRVGYADSKFEVGSSSDSGGGVAYGVGAQYDFGVNGVRADYTKYDFDGTDGDSFAISYVRKF